MLKVDKVYHTHIIKFLCSNVKRFVVRMHRHPHINLYEYDSQFEFSKWITNEYCEIFQTQLIIDTNADTQTYLCMNIKK